MAVKNLLHVFVGSRMRKQTRAICLLAVLYDGRSILFLVNQGNCQHSLIGDATSVLFILVVQETVKSISL